APLEIRKTKKVGVSDPQVIFGKRFVCIPYREGLPPDEPKEAFDAGTPGCHSCSRRKPYRRRLHTLTCKDSVCRQTVNAISISMKRIVGQFVLYVKDDKEAAGDAKGQAGNVDQGECLMPYDISQRNRQVVLKHDRVSLWVVRTGFFKVKVSRIFPCFFSNPLNIFDGRTQDRALRLRL